MDWMIPRRKFVGMAGATAFTLATGELAGATVGGGQFSSVAAAAQDAPTGPFTLPALPYDFDALEPHIDATTMQIHHDKHHAAYVANLNKAVVSRADLQSLTVLELIMNLD